MTGAVNQTLQLDCAACKQDYMRHKVLPLASYSLTPYHFLCTGAGHSRPEGCRRARRSAAPAPWANWSRPSAARRSTSPAPRSTRPCSAARPTARSARRPWLRSYSLWDLAKVVTTSTVGTYHGTNFINIRTDTWKKLSPKERRR